MDKLINHFGLESTSTQEDILNKVSALETEKGQKEAELKTANETIKTLKNQIATAKVEAAIEKGIFDPSNKEELIKSAEKDPEAFDTLAKSIKTKPVSVINAINTDSGPKEEDRSKWTIYDWEKKDPEGLLNLIKTEPEKYNSILK